MAGALSDRNDPGCVTCASSRAQSGAIQSAAHRQHQLMDKLALTHLTVPSGSQIPIDYSEDVPVLAVRLQEMFGLAQTPSVAGGRQPLLIHLLSPAGRPLQITRDLAGFWQSGYHEVKRELKMIEEWNIGYNSENYLDFNL